MREINPSEKAPSHKGGKTVMLKKIRHIGIIGEDLDRAITKFAGFGLPCKEVIENKQVGAKLAFLPVGDAMLEFIMHTGPDKGDDAMTSLVRNQTGSINHICFEVDDLEVTIQDFERNGARLVEGSPRPGAHGRVAFFYPETTEGILIELCEV
jgi:methylmalonyl-CoA/ethylmalonyl-CoA epimerase